MLIKYVKKHKKVQTKYGIQMNNLKEDKKYWKNSICQKDKIKNEKMI